MTAPSPQDNLRHLIGGFRAWVSRQADDGTYAFRRQAAAGPSADALSPASFSGPRAVEPAGEDSAAELTAIRSDIGDCRRCKLCAGRTHIVFGVGNPRADIVFVGEGPGEEEDLRAEPFVGRAGQLLTDIITKGMGLKRSDVYIANVVKCRPPNNRNPEPDEIAACQPFLIRQIEAIRPRVIVALGKFAAQTLLASTVPISKLRGRWYEYRGTKLMPTFHPSYLLRNPADKKLVWEDIRLVMQEVGLPIPETPKPRGRTGAP